MLKTEYKKLENYTFGLIIKNFSKKKKYEEEDIEIINNLLVENKLLVIKDIILDNKEFMNFAQQLGELEITHPVQYQVPGYPYIRIQSNTLKIGLDYVGQYWHSDGSWQKVPTKATLLLNLESPEKGGETLFIDMCAVYEDLPKELKTTIEKLKGFYPSREIYLREMKELGLEISEEQNSHLTNTIHPIVKSHPITGRKSLYISENLLEKILEVPEDESKELLDFLYKFSTEEFRIYKHKWEKGDLLIWDNSTIIHKGIRPDPNYPKTTKRITVKEK